MSTTFMLPSIYDGTDLECRLTLPDQQQETLRRAGGIVAHPYAPLGGCFDDHVVRTVVEELASVGVPVLSFNSR